MDITKTALTIASVLALGSTFGTPAFALDLGAKGGVGVGAGVSGSTDRGSAGAGVGIHGDMDAGVNAPTPSITRPGNSGVVPSTDAALDHTGNRISERTTGKGRKLKSSKKIKTQTELESESTFFDK